MYQSKNDTGFVAIGASDKRARGGNENSDMVLHMNISIRARLSDRRVRTI